MARGTDFPLWWVFTNYGELLGGELLGGELLGGALLTVAVRC